jgi:hypothetical protein
MLPYDASHHTPNAARHKDAVHSLNTVKKGISVDVLEEACLQNWDHDRHDDYEDDDRHYSIRASPVKPSNRQEAYKCGKKAHQHNGSHQSRHQREKSGDTI